MKNILDAIKNRRSIRKYKTAQIADAELKTLIESALNAPTARNEQKWHFTVIQNPALLDEMVKTIKANLLNSGIPFFVERASAPDYHTFYHAPTVVLISADESAPLAPLDCAAAAENLIIAAESLNIGSCFITSASSLFALPKGDEYRFKLAIPDGYKFVCAITLGYKDGDTPTAPPRYQDVINYIK